MLLSFTVALFIWSQAVLACLWFDSCVCCQHNFHLCWLYKSYAISYPRHFCDRTCQQWPINLQIEPLLLCSPGYLKLKPCLFGMFWDFQSSFSQIARVCESYVYRLWWTHLSFHVYLLQGKMALSGAVAQGKVAIASFTLTLAEETLVWNDSDFEHPTPIPPWERSVLDGKLAPLPWGIRFHPPGFCRQPELISHYN